MDRNLALEAVRVTEATALAASRFMGRGDERAADQAAVEAMQRALDGLQISGTVINGEGEAGETEMLYTGQPVGIGGDNPHIDIVLDPLEGSTICAKGGYNALAVVGMAARGAFLKVPDIYMDKIAVGPGLPPEVVDLDEKPATNLNNLAKAKGVEVRDLVVCVLDRPRHDDLIAQLWDAGARVMLMTDGDVAGVIATTQPPSAVDMYLGIGGAPQGVLAAAALYCVGGQMQGRLVARNDAERAAVAACGIEDAGHKFELGEMASGDVMFAATGVTNGVILSGVRRFVGGATTHSMVIRSKSGTVRFIEANHNSIRKGGLDCLGQKF